MKSIWTISVIFGILFIGSLGLTPNVYAPQGEIVWLNPAEKLGKIAQDGCDDESCYHPFQIPKDLADPNYNPQIGDKVTFDPAPGNTASNVAIAGDPSITPTEGLIGTPFTITDPQRRIQAGDLAFFTPEGGDPAVSGIAVIGVISPDGTTLTGTVPTGITEFGAQLVRVAAAGDQPGRFADLAFFVTSVPPGTVVAYFQDENGDRIPNAFCRAFDGSGFNLQDDGFTDENGQVTFNPLNPLLGSYLVICSQDNVTFGSACANNLDITSTRIAFVTEGFDDTFSCGSV